VPASFRRVSGNAGKEKSGCFGNFSGKCNLKEINLSLSFYSSKSGGLALYKRNQALLIRGDPATVNKVPGNVITNKPLN
jgi:hypothetical protein